MEHVPELVRYHIRVNERILDQSVKLSEEEFRREARQSSHTSSTTVRSTGPRWRGT